MQHEDPQLPQGSSSPAMMGKADGSPVYSRSMLQIKYWGQVNCGEVWEQVREASANLAAFMKVIIIYFLYIYHVERSQCPPPLVGRAGDGVVEGLGRGIGMLLLGRGHFVEASDGSSSQGIPLGLH